MEEKDNRWCTGPFNRSAMDRFLLTQPCGKQRPIDDGAQNSGTEMSETIYTTGMDMLPVCARRIARQVLNLQGVRDVNTVLDAAAALPP